MKVHLITALYSDYWKAAVGRIADHDVPSLLYELTTGHLEMGVPTHAIMPVWLASESVSESFPNARILLTDFGESLNNNTK